MLDVAVLVTGLLAINGVILLDIVSARKRARKEKAKEARARLDGWIREAQDAHHPLAQELAMRRFWESVGMGVIPMLGTNIRMFCRLAGIKPVEFREHFISFYGAGKPFEYRARRRPLGRLLYSLPDLTGVEVDRTVWPGN